MRNKSFNPPSKRQMLIDEIRNELLSGKYMPGDRMPTENEICKTYGLSLMTVREAIGALVHEELLYRIQGKGTFVSEKKNERRTIGLIMPHLHLEGDMEHSIGYNISPGLVHAIDQEANACGADIMLYLCNDDHEREKENLQNAIDRMVDGVIIYYMNSSENEEALNAVQKAGIPIVLIDRYVKNMDVDYVGVDNVDGAYQAVKSLIDSGFERVYHFTMESDWSSINERMLGYRKAMEEYGLSTEGLVIKGPPSEEIAKVEKESYHFARGVLDTEEKPFAIFALNAPILVGVWRAIKEMGFDPNRVALGCFDEPITDIPRGTTFVRVVQPLDEIGRKSVQLVLGKARADSSVQHIVLDPNIKMSSASKLVGAGADSR